MDEVAVLRALVEQYSPSGQEHAAVRTFLEAARSLGFGAHADAAGNGIARIGAGRPTILFLGHIDTVEGDLPVRLEGGRLFGRGTCDAKGALAAALIAASHQEGPGQVIVAAAVGEERDSRGTRHLLPHHRPKFVIVGEPSRWDGVTIGYKGNVSLILRFDGERAHLSAPTPTTVEASLAVVDRLRRVCDDRAGTSPFRSLTMKVHAIHTIRSGSREQVEIGLNLRLPPGLPVDEVLDLVRQNAEGIGCEVVDRSDAVEVDPRNDVVRALCTGVRSLGGRPTLVRKLGTSDLNLAAPAWGCPAAAYGPGDSHLDHTDAESLDIDELHRSIRVLRMAFSVLARHRRVDPTANGSATPSADAIAPTAT